MRQHAQIDAARTCLFDLDGVLIDSEGRWDEIRRRLAQEAGRPWPAEATRAMQGMSTSEWSGYLVSRVGLPGTAERVAEQVIAAMAELYARDVPLIPGAVEAVQRLAARWPLGLASSSPRTLIDAVLAASGLDGQFQVTVSTEEVAAGKPSPVVYSRVVDLLGVEPAQTVAVEDSSNGLRSASGAGLVVVAVPHDAFPPADDALALAAVTLGSLDDLTSELVDSLG